MQLNIPQTILTVFYAIIWGGLANALPRWRAFDTGHLFDRDEGGMARHRFLAAFPIMNLFPIVYLVWLLRIESGIDIHDWRVGSMTRVFVAALPSLAPLGFYRIWSAVVQYRADYFYPPRTSDDWAERYPGLKPWELEQKLFMLNLVFGAFYILIPLALLVGARCF